MGPIQKKLKEAIESRGMTLKEASLAIGKNHAYLQQFIHRGIPERLKEIDRRKLSELLQIPEEELGAIPDARPKKSRKPGIPSLDLRAGLGGGGFLTVMANDDGEIIDPEQVRGYWNLPDDVTAQFRRLSRIYAVPVTGDSMEPTLAGGSFVFVDTAHTFPQPEDIYACDYGDGLVVKRLKLVPKSDKIRIISDNPIYGEDELLRDGLHVYGRVVAWFQWR